MANFKKYTNSRQNRNGFFHYDYNGNTMNGLYTASPPWWWYASAQSSNLYYSHGEKIIFEGYNGVIGAFGTTTSNAGNTGTVTVNIDGVEDSHDFVHSAMPSYWTHLNPMSNIQSYGNGHQPVYFKHIVIKMQVGSGSVNYIYARYTIRCETFVGGW